MDYHDLKILELEQAAEEHLNQAKLALERGDEDAAKEIDHCQETLEKIRQLKSSEQPNTADRASAWGKP